MLYLEYFKGLVNVRIYEILTLYSSFDSADTGNWRSEEHTSELQSGPEDHHTQERFHDQIN